MEKILRKISVQVKGDKIVVIKRYTGGRSTRITKRIK